MNLEPEIVVLCGGASEEAEVSRASGRCISEALKTAFEVRLVELEDDDVPDDLNPETQILFPAFHGGFGENGQVQQLFEDRGFVYAGSNPSASALCMNKIDTKAVVFETGFEFADDLTFRAASPPQPNELIESIGEDVVLKPFDKGSSIGLYRVKGSEQMKAALATLRDGGWMAEKWIHGREMTIGILNGRALGVVEICPRGGVYDYAHKYQAGSTEYRVPAEITQSYAKEFRRWAEEAFRLCACRDFARLDFIFTEDHEAYFLEINTIPGLTPTSLLPKSAACMGYSFEELAKEMVGPARERFQRRKLNLDERSLRRILA